MNRTSPAPTSRRTTSAALKRRSALCAVLFTSVACTSRGTVFTALKAKVVVSDEVIDLGEVVISEPASHDLEVVNAGQSDLDISNIEVIDGGSDYSLDIPEMVIEPGESMIVGVTLIPTSVGDMGRDLVIESDDPDNPEFIVPILATAIDTPEPDIDLSHTELDFGAVAAGSAAPFGFVEVYNLGRAELQVDQITLTGSGAFSVNTSGDFTVEPQTGSNTLIVEYNPTVDTGDSATLTITSNDPDEPSVEIALIGNGGGAANYPEALIDCPTVVYPPSTVSFDGSGSTDPAGGTLEYLWDLTDAPAGFESSLYDTTGGEGTVPVSESSSLFVDLAGDYEVQLRVRNEDEVLSAPAVCRFAAVPENAIHVELVWDETDADLDLHLAQEGYEMYQVPGDVNWCNENPDWGASGDTADDPYLELDSTEGPGPENILLPSPSDGDYYVRVHHYTDNGANDVLATVKIWIEGELFTTRSMRLDTNRVWDVGYIRWPAAVFVPLTGDPEIYEGARRCPPE